MIRKLLNAAVAAALVATPATAQAPQSDPGREALRLIDVWLDAAQAYDRVPSLSVAIVQGDETIWSNGYGTSDAGRTLKTTPQTLYSICSISKLFTAIALMQQWEQGRVSIDVPVTTYLPWAQLKRVEQDSVPITLRAILTHSAGLPRESDYPYWTAPDFEFPTDEQVRARITGQEPLYPGSRWYQYSNLGLTLVGDTVAAVSGQDYAAYAQKYLLDPLKLTDTHPAFPMALYGNRLAVGWGGLTRDGSRDLIKPFDTRAILPAAGYTSTAEDLARFAAWQFRLLRTGKAEVLKASTLREMQRVQFTDPAWTVTRGLGFGVSRRGGRTYVGHSGSCPGYQTTLSLRPESETAVVAMLTGAEGPGAYAAGMFAILDKRSGFAFKSPAPAPRVRLEDFAGRYSVQPWGSESGIIPWAGGLAMMDLPNNNPVSATSFLKPKGGDAFRVVRDDGSEADEIRFERDNRGRVVRLIRFSNRYPRIADLPEFKR